MYGKLGFFSTIHKFVAFLYPIIIHSTNNAFALIYQTRTVGAAMHAVQAKNLALKRKKHYFAFMFLQHARLCKIDRIARFC
jgi:hypothetical protein